MYSLQPRCCICYSQQAYTFSCRQCYYSTKLTQQTTLAYINTKITKLNWAVDKVDIVKLLHETNAQQKTIKKIKYLKQKIKMKRKYLQTLYNRNNQLTNRKYWSYYHWKKLSTLNKTTIQTKNSHITYNNKLQQEYQYQKHLTYTIRNEQYYSLYILIKNLMISYSASSYNYYTLMWIYRRHTNLNINCFDRLKVNDQLISNRYLMGKYYFLELIKQQARALAAMQNVKKVWIPYPIHKTRTYVLIGGQSVILEHQLPDKKWEFNVSYLDNLLADAVYILKIFTYFAQWFMVLNCLEHDMPYKTGQSLRYYLYSLSMQAISMANETGRQYTMIGHSNDGYYFQIVVDYVKSNTEFEGYNKSKQSSDEEYEII